MMLELAISFWLSFKSFLIVTVNSGGNAYHERKAITVEGVRIRAYKGWWGETH